MDKQRAIMLQKLRAELAVNVNALDHAVAEVYDKLEAVSRFSTAAQMKLFMIDGMEKEEQANGNPQ